MINVIAIIFTSVSGVAGVIGILSQRAAPKVVKSLDTKAHLTVPIEVEDSWVAILRDLQMPNFKVHQIMRRGEHHAVFKISFPDTPEPLALKVFLASEGKEVLAAQRESYALSWLNGMGAPRARQIVRTSDFRAHALIREWVLGETLEQYVEHRGRTLDLFEANEVLQAILGAVTKIHNGGIIHGDIKPSNIVASWDAILSGEDGQAVLIDFGLATPMSDPSTAEATNIQGLNGTPLFTAPELFFFSSSAAQSDVYSCGAVVDYLIRGYQGSLEDLPFDVSRVIRKALQPRPRDRFSSISDFKTAWDGALHRVAGRNVRIPLQSFALSFPANLRVTLMRLSRSLSQASVQGNHLLEKTFLKVRQEFPELYEELQEQLDQERPDFNKINGFLTAFYSEMVAASRYESLTQATQAIAHEIPNTALFAANDDFSAGGHEDASGL